MEDNSTEEQKSMTPRSKNSLFGLYTTLKKNHTGSVDSSEDEDDSESNSEENSVFKKKKMNQPIKIEKPVKKKNKEIKNENGSDIYFVKSNDYDKNTISKLHHLTSPREIRKKPTKKKVISKKKPVKKIKKGSK